MSENPNLAVQAAFAGAVMAGDLDTVRSLCTDDFVCEQGSGMSYAGIYNGADGFIAFLGIFASTYELEKLEPVRMFHCDDPDVLVAEFDLAATFLATGKRYETSLLEAWHFRGGKVCAVKPHYFHSPLHDPKG